MTNPSAQTVLELADELDSLAELLSEATTGSQAGFDRLCKQAAVALRAALSKKLGSSEPLGPLYDGTTMDNQQLHGTTRRNQPVVTAGETASAVAGEAERPRWKHKKRGTIYTEIGRGLLQIGGLTDNEPIVIYQNEETGAIWVRDQVEFEDGRFEFLPSATLPPSQPSTAAEAASTSAELGRWCYENPNLAALTIEGLRSQINTPETANFMQGVPLEAAHQRQRWGTDHDDGKAPLDWFWLIGYLAQKAATSAMTGDIEKAKHHTISTAAALATWHLRLSGGDDRMRPGISSPEAASSQQSIEVDDDTPLEVWHWDRKVTIYKNEVMRIWGPDMEDQMSSEKRDHQTVAAAFDWLYGE